METDELCQYALYVQGGWMCAYMYMYILHLNNVIF